MARQHEENEYEEVTQPRRPLSGVWGALLVLAGLGLVAAGLGLVLLPRFAPEYEWSVRNLARQGVTGGPLAICGALLVAFGWLSRGQARMSRQVADQPDAQIFLEHVAQELASLHEGTQGIDARLGALRDATQGLIEAVEARESLSGTDADARDSIFRLAASLDRMAARLEQGQIARHQETATALETLGARIEELALQAAAAATRAPEPGTKHEASDGRTLGLLDQLDENGAPRPAQPSEVLRISPSASDDAGSSAAPTAAQLEELRSLLSDQRVRRALEGLKLG
jgi:hypothetical protein